MEDSQMSWSDSNDVLQDFMVGPGGSQSHCDLLDFQYPGLALGDSTSNPLLELHLPDFASLEAQSQPLLMNHWSSSEPQVFYYPHYPSSRLTSDQDAWNPLQVTGVPDSSSVFHMEISALGNQDYGFSKPCYDTPSENGSQYVESYHSADSGYGGTSCASQSVVTSSYGIDSMSSPHIPPCGRGLGESTPIVERSQAGSGPVFSYSPSQSLEGSVKCDHPSCSWVGKCPSDKRKHEARHRKLFKCDEPNCPRREGFGTINDLARHKKCVHNKEPERGPKMMYLCFGKNCPRPNKRWPRLDNFKQHLNRMHHGEDADALLKRSMDWYENVMGRRASQSLDDTISQDGTLVDSQLDLESVTEMDVDSTDVMHPAPEVVDFPSSGAPSPNICESNAGSETLLDTHSSQYPALETIDQASSLPRPRSESLIERENANSEIFVTNAADNLINAMKRMMNNHARRPSQNSDERIEVGAENTQLSQVQRQMLQKVFSAALDRLSTDTSSSTSDGADSKQAWFQCDICSKRTRLRCEMKKHQKRHERPYGCTFPHCAKSFGSKADWKRHESSQHLHVPGWFCALHDASKGATCGRIFHREEIYSQHLSQQHQLPKNRMRSSLNAARLDLAGQSQFWCGFCNEMIPLQSQGSAALDERFNHIDVEHFKKGEKGQDWSFSSVGVLGGASHVAKTQNIQTFDKNSRKRKFSRQ